MYLWGNLFSNLLLIWSILIVFLLLLVLFLYFECYTFKRYTPIFFFYFFWLSFLLSWYSLKWMKIEIRLILIFFFQICLWYHSSTKYCVTEVCKESLPFSPNYSAIFAVTFSSLNHFKLTFQYAIRVQIHYFIHGDPVVPPAIAVKAFISLMSCTGMLVKIKWA